MTVTVFYYLVLVVVLLYFSIAFLGRGGDNVVICCCDCGSNVLVFCNSDRGDGDRICALFWLYLQVLCPVNCGESCNRCGVGVDSNVGRINSRSYGVALVDGSSVCRQRATK